MVTGFLFRRFKQGLPRKAVWKKALKRADPIVALALGRNHLHLFICELGQNLSAYPAGPDLLLCPFLLPLTRTSYQFALGKGLSI